MPPLATDRLLVQGQYSDADKLQIRIETHGRYSRGDTECIVDDCVAALALSQGLHLLDVGCGAGSWHSRIAAAGVEDPEHWTYSNLAEQVLAAERPAPAT